MKSFYWFMCIAWSIYSLLLIFDIVETLHISGGEAIILAGINMILAKMDK